MRKMKECFQINLINRNKVKKLYRENTDMNCDLKELLNMELICARSDTREAMLDRLIKI